MSDKSAFKKTPTSSRFTFPIDSYCLVFRPSKQLEQASVPRGTIHDESILWKKNLSPQPIREDTYLNGVVLEMLAEISSWVVTRSNGCKTQLALGPLQRIQNYSALLQVEGFWRATTCSKTICSAFGSSEIWYEAAKRGPSGSEMRARLQLTYRRMQAVMQKLPVENELLITAFVFIVAQNCCVETCSWGAPVLIWYAAICITTEEATRKSGIDEADSSVARRVLKSGLRSQVWSRDDLSSGRVSSSPDCESSVSLQISTICGGRLTSCSENEPAGHE